MQYCVKIGLRILANVSSPFANRVTDHRQDEGALVAKHPLARDLPVARLPRFAVTVLIPNLDRMEKATNSLATAEMLETERPGDSLCGYYRQQETMCSRTCAIIPEQ